MPPSSYDDIQQQPKRSNHKDTHQAERRDPPRNTDILTILIDPSTGPEIKCQKVYPRRRRTRLTGEERHDVVELRTREQGEKHGDIWKNKRAIEQCNGNNEYARSHDALRPTPFWHGNHKHPKRQNQQATQRKNLLHPITYLLLLEKIHVAMHRASSE